MSETDYDRFVESGEGLVFYRQDNMLCARCRFATGEASSCAKYRTKPFAVMDGADSCPRFEAAAEAPAEEAAAEPQPSADEPDAPPEECETDDELFFRELYLNSAIESFRMILCLDLETMRCSILRASAEGFSYAVKDVPWEEKRRDILDSIRPEDQPQVEANWGDIITEAQAGRRSGVTFRSSLWEPEGKYGWWNAQSRVLERDGRKVMVTLFANVTAEVEERQALIERSERDGLTGLYSRAKLAEMLSGRYSSLQSCAVIFLDLNGLKEANDNFGHETGDRMIRLVADSLRTLERTGVTPYRYGGDEFLIISEDVDREEVGRLVQLWLSDWRTLQARSEISCSIAVGIAWGSAPVNVRTLIEKADSDMYHNKHLMKAGILPDLNSYDSNDLVAGLYGRQDFFKAVRQLLENNADREYFMLSLGIGHFPLVNQWFGRETGDKLLSKVSRSISYFAHDHGGLGCYLESERFAMVLPADEQLPYLLDGELRQILKGISNSVGFQLSIGVYRITDPDMKVFTMLDYAAEAQNQVADNSSNRVFFHERLNSGTAIQQQKLLGDLKAGLLDGEVGLWLLPVCTSDGEKFVSAEAHARWTHPSWGLMEPESFIPTLEEWGLTADLDQVIWERSAAFLRAWIDEGVAPVPITLIVTRSDILSLDVTACFRDLAEKYGLERRLLQAVVHADAMKGIGDEATRKGNSDVGAAIFALQEQGFPVFIDISTAPRSVVGGLSLPSNRLKADLRALPSGGSVGMLLRQLIARARENGAPVIVAGVENEEQALLLRELAPDGVQGDYYYPPMPADDFTWLLKHQ